MGITGLRRGSPQRQGHCVARAVTKLRIIGFIKTAIGVAGGDAIGSVAFQSQVVGVGPQVGFIFPVGTCTNVPGWLNLHT